MVKKMNKKAFTLIEVLVVVAIIGILALLAIPRFIGQTQKAELVRIQHDVKAMEKEIGAKLINGDDGFNEWESNSKDLNQLVQDKELFENEGVATEVESIDGTYKIVPKEYKNKINTKLKGTFYANSGGKVYYEHGQGPGYSDEELEDLIKNHDFIPVATADELNNVRSATLETYGKGTEWEGKYLGGLDKQYVQVKDIDLSGYSEEGWEPIGTDPASFRGTYDGGNYVITDLEVKGAGKNYQGLFGYTQGATISNVGLIDNKVTGKSYTGGLVGMAGFKTTISNSYATGSVIGGGFYIGDVGGLVGHATSGTISNSYATGSVTGERSNVGGLVGYAGLTVISNSYAKVAVEGTGTGNFVGGVGGLVGSATWGDIEKSYATGTVTGPERVGGLVGDFALLTIKNSYATGSVTGSNKLGGLVGEASNSHDFSPTIIENSYATGSVTGTGNQVGGLLGNVLISSTRATNSYWDRETTGRTTSTRGIGKSTVEMKNADTYSAWDTDVWNIVNGEYPTLR